MKRFVEPSSKPGHLIVGNALIASAALISLV